MKWKILIVWMFVFFPYICGCSCSTENDLQVSNVNDGKIRGTVYFSNGSDLIKYNFADNKKEFLFRYQEDTDLGRRITHITYPVYLKDKKRILFIGANSLCEMNIFESDLDLTNWKDYRNTKAGVLSLSPDESTIAYYGHPNKLVIKKYDDLGKDGYEQTVASNISAGDRPLWISNSALLYHSVNNNIVKVDINSKEQTILVDNLMLTSISPDKEYALCSDDNSIYLYDMKKLQLKLLNRGTNLFFSLPDIWSPDENYFLLSKVQNVILSINIARAMNSLTANKRDLYVHCLTTGEEEKILENENARFGGFWL